MERRRTRQGARDRPSPPAARAPGVWERSFLSTHGRVATFGLLTLAWAGATIVHWPALGTFFAQDDVTFLSRARGLENTPWSLARPLSEAALWRALHAAFGLQPLPYHVFNLALHLANVALVYAIGVRLVRSRLAAFAGALLFGTSAIAFTPLHWISGLVELSVTTFALAAFLTWLLARERDSIALSWLAALAALAALLAKENAILLPLVLWVAHLRMGDRAPMRPEAGGAAAEGRQRSLLLPATLATLAYAIAFVATIRRVHYVGSEAYAMTASPAFLFLNLGTYLAWLASPHVAVRDAVAAMDPRAWVFGLPVAIAIVAILWSQRRERRHPEEVGGIWFAAFLAPVVPLAHHTYLYYLYLPSAGLAWLAAGAMLRAVRAGGRARVARAFALGATSLGVAALVIADHAGVRARRAAMRGPLVQDKTLREAMLLRHSLEDLRRAGVVAGQRIVFVNPGPFRRVSLLDGPAAGPTSMSIPLEGALRNGESIRLFLPGVEYLGFTRDLPHAWEDAQVFFYGDDGRLQPLGSGGPALARLGSMLLPEHDWRRADAMLSRSLALGDTLADAVFGLLITRHYLGRHAESRHYAQEFLRRWPDDPRARTVREDTLPEAGELDRTRPTVGPP